jgi:hypothetical protein
VALAGGLALALAAPWFLFQLAAHARGFRAEPMAVEIPQTSQENRALYYLTRAAVLDPVLLAAMAASIPTFARELRRRSAPGILLLLGLALPAMAALLWQDRNVAYLLPLVPLAAILATAYNPLCSGPPAKWTLAALVLIFVVKAAAPSAIWGLPFQSGTVVAAAPLLSDYCERARGNELIVLDTPDEGYGSLLPIPKLRYVPRRASPAEIAAMVAAHPESDFLMPAKDAASFATHDAVKASEDSVLLLSRRTMASTGPRWSCRL